MSKFTLHNAIKSDDVNGPVTIDQDVTITGDLQVDGSISGGAPATQLDSNGTILDVDAIANGEFLKRVGTSVVGAASGGSPAGADGAIQINDGGSFGGVNRRIVDGTAITTDGTTPQVLATIALSANTVYRIWCEAVGRTTAVGAGSIGDASIAAVRAVVKRVGGGAVAVDVQALIAPYSFSEQTPATLDVVASGNNVEVKITGGDAGTTVSWTAAIVIDSVGA